MRALERPGRLHRYRLRRRREVSGRTLLRYSQAFQKPAQQERGEHRSQRNLLVVLSTKGFLTLAQLCQICANKCDNGRIHAGMDRSTLFRQYRGSSSLGAERSSVTGSCRDSCLRCFFGITTLLSEALKSGVFLARTKEPALVLAGSHDGIRNEAAQYSDLSVG